jgi:hypothetical protein
MPIGSCFQMLGMHNTGGTQPVHDPLTHTEAGSSHAAQPTNGFSFPFMM